MPATTSHPRLRALPFRAPAVRLALRPQSPAGGRTEVEGVPRPRDLVSELSTPADVAAERARHGRSDAAEDGSNDACASHDLDQRNAVGR